MSDSPRLCLVAQRELVVLSEGCGPQPRSGAQRADKAQPGPFPGAQAAFRDVWAQLWSAQLWSARDARDAVSTL